MKNAGIMVKADTLVELAAKLDMDPVRLESTVRRFNGFARAGVDGDFGRGNSAYDRYYGDPTVHPNACLGPLERGPFTAFKVVIGDLGTKGGVVTDSDTRALREDGTVIEGLYSAGNNSASVMGGRTPARLHHRARCSVRSPRGPPHDTPTRLKWEGSDPGNWFLACSNRIRRSGQGPGHACSSSTSESPGRSMLTCRAGAGSDLLR